MSGLHAAPERWQHGADSETDDGRQRVASGVAALLRSRKIGPAEVASAERWYRDYTLGVHGAFDAEPGASSGGGDAHTAMFARAKAKHAYYAALAAVGHQGDAVLRLFLAEGQTYERIGSAINLDRKAAVGAVVITLRRLTEQYNPNPATGPECGIIRNATFTENKGS